MPKIDPKQFKLLKRSPAGKISAQEILGGTVQVEGSFAYTLIDAGTGKLPPKLQAKRNGQDLQLLVDGEPVLRLEGFYAPVNGNTAFDGSGELFAPAAGNYDSGYALVTGDALGASDKVIVGKPDAPVGDEGGWSWITWGGLIGLGILGAAAAGGSSGGGGSGGSNGGGTGGNNGGGTGGGTGGNTGGNTGGGDPPLPPLSLLSQRAGIVGPDGLANAKVQVRFDANADGRIDATEAASALSATLVSSAPNSGYRGQFSLPDAISADTFNPATGVLQFTSTGGSKLLLGSEVAVTGSLQTMAYLTHPVSASSTSFQVVLSPLTTLGANLFRQELALGAPPGFDLARAYDEDLGYVSDALGLPMSAGALMSVAPERSPALRLVAELKANALMNGLVALASGKSTAPTDAASLALSESSSADVAYRLANYITHRGSFDLGDAAQLKAAFASVLPASLAIDDVLAGTLAKMMAIYDLALEGGGAMSRVPDAMLPEFSRIVAGLNQAMNAGTLSSDGVQSGVKAAMDVLLADLRSKLADANAGGFVHVIADAAGARLDLNFDGRIDDEDKVDGNFISADFAVGKNADPAANRVFVTYLTLPTATQAQVLKTFGTNDGSTFVLDPGNTGNRIDLKWSAADANAALKKQDLALTARGAASTALLSIGKLPAVSSTEGITASFGALAILAAGDAHGVNDLDAPIFSKANVSIGLGGKDASGAPLAGSIAGPVRVQAAGRQSEAALTALSNAGIDAADLSAITTGVQAKATLQMQAAGSGVLKANRVSATSHASEGESELGLASVDGNVVVGSQISALAAGDGSSSSVTVSSTKGAILIASTSGTSTTYGDVSAIASGSTLTVLDTDRRTTASVNLSSDAGSISLGALCVLASGVNSIASVTADAEKGTVTVNGAVTVAATGYGADAQLDLSGYSATATGTGLMLGSSLSVSTSATAASSLVSVNLESLGGAASLQGYASQSATGAHSAIQTSVSAADRLTVGQHVVVTSGGSQSSSDLSLTANGGLSIGAAGSSADAKSVTLASAGYGSAASLALTGDVIVAGDVTLARSGAMASDSTQNFTRLSVSGASSMVDIHGKLDLKSEASAVGGKVSAVFGAGKAGTYAAKIGGDLLLQSAGYGSKAEFDASATEGLSSLDIGGNWRTISSGTGDLVGLNYGSLANVSLSGAATMLHVGGNLEVIAGTELSRALLETSFVPASGTASASGSIAGSVLVSATGYGSQAWASFTGLSVPDIVVSGNVSVAARGSAAAAIFDAGETMSARGNLSVLADSGAGSMSGAFASMSIGVDAIGGRNGNVNAVRAGDVAILTVNNAAYGGSYTIGSASGAGMSYLQINGAPAQSIRISYQQQGNANILLGTQDQDLSAQAAIGGMVTIDGFRTGTDALIIPWAPPGANFQMSGYPFFSDLQTFLRDAIRDIGSEPFPHSDAAAYRSAYSMTENVTYIAYDLDGTGLTGLVKLTGNHYLFNFNDPVTLPAATGIDSSVINPTLRSTVAAGSVTNANGGDIIKTAVVVNADVAEKQTLTLSTSDGNVRMQSLSATASAYFSQAILDLSPGRGGLAPAPELAVAGDVNLTAGGRSSLVKLAVNQSPSGMIVGGNLNAVASGDGSLIRAEVNDVFRQTYGNLVRLQATGAYSEVELKLTQANVEAERTFSGGLALQASGFQSKLVYSQADGNDSHTTFNGPVSVNASGAESSSSMNVDYKLGDIHLAAGLQVNASGDKASASVAITKDYLIVSNLAPSIRIGADVAIKAIGESSIARVSIASSSDPALELGANLLAEASGGGAEASFDAQLSARQFSVNQVRATANGAAAESDINVSLGQFIFQGSPTATRVGGGRISTRGDVTTGVSAVNARASVTMRTFSDDIVIGGALGALAQFGNAGSSAPDARISLWAGAGRLTTGNDGDVLDYDTISGYGAVTVAGNVSAISTGVGAASDVSLFAVGKALTIGAGVNLAATATASVASVALQAQDGADSVTPTTVLAANINISGALQLEASGTGSSAQLAVVANRGQVKLSGTSSVVASGVGADAALSVSSLRSGISAGGDLIVSATAADSHASISVKSGELHNLVQSATPSVTISGGLHVLASGSDSRSDAEISNEAVSGKISIGQSVTVGALGEGSHAHLLLKQGSASDVTVAGTMLLSADSSMGVAAGAAVDADLTLGKLGSAPVDLFLRAMQQDDTVSATLSLYADGGRAQLGGSGEAGIASLTLGEKTSAANQLVDQVDIAFSGSSGKAIVNFGADQDSMTASALQQVLVKGFRIDQDELNFGTLSKVVTTAKTLDGFISAAIDNFNTTSSGTTSSQPVAEVFIGGNDSQTYLAYDYDGTGISAIIVLDGVSASAYKTHNGLA